MMVTVGDRAIVRANDTVVPAFRVDIEFRGLQTTSWVTDTGEIVREESPLGLMTVREPPERAQGLAVSGRIQADLLQAAAVVPQTPADRRAARCAALEAAARRRGPLPVETSMAWVSGRRQRDRDRRIRGRCRPGAARSDVRASISRRAADRERRARRFAPRPSRRSRGAHGDRDRAERLTRYVNGLLDKKPTVSLPSAREVLRTKVGDCNEHTALFVAMARSIGMPARIAVGLVFMHGAFYYHAWPEVLHRPSGLVEVCGCPSIRR